MKPREAVNRTDQKEKPLSSLRVAKKKTSLKYTSLEETCLKVAKKNQYGKASWIKAQPIQVHNTQIL